MRHVTLRKTLLAMAVGCAASYAQAASAEAQAQDTIVVQAAGEAFTPGGDTPPPAYLDGQVAHGGRLGMLGEQRAMDVPFNVISFTSKLVEDQQARTVADVVRNDAGVQNVQGYGNFQETYRIRGFALEGDDMTFSGLGGVMPRQVVEMAMVDRVEIFKGANALVNGASTTGVGGVINLEPKHADDLPLTRLGVDYTSASQAGVTLDAGRRFGDAEQFGARVNLVQREGETAVDNEKRRTTFASVGLDYKGDRLKTSLDLGYQKQGFHGGRIGVDIRSVDVIPAVPKATQNYSQDWVYSDLESQFGMARAEYALTDDWTLYGGLGGQHSHEKGLYATPRLLNAAGDATMGRMDTNRIIDNFSGMGGVRGRFDTGFISHQVNVGYSAIARRDATAWRMAKTTRAVNIYDPVDVGRPPNASASGNYGSPPTTGRSRTQGWLLSDTLGVLDDRVLLTVAARHQKVVVRKYSAKTGDETRDSRFNDSRWMPTYGIVYKPTEQVSLYANHTESLEPGGSAPSTAANYGESTGILHSKQNEAGVKVDFGRLGGTLTAFEIKKPVATQDSVTNIYALSGEQRNRGVELNLFGEPVLGLRLNASATWIDPQMTRTKDGVNDGNDAVGVPRFAMRVGSEVDIAPVEGLTASAWVNHTGAQYANAANTRKLDDFTTLDLGVRYRMTLNDQQNVVTWRAGVDNVTNEKYWSTVESSGIYLYQGKPRTLKLSMSYDF
ncbi:TonB-dependent siderophore receptor [Cronobacter muytjensii]|uniref:TonB-dependent receptor n=1 Tax=Cronobacter muytjensii TaxID=413501 RepID=UPI0034D76C0B